MQQRYGRRRHPTSPLMLPSLWLFCCLFDVVKIGNGFLLKPTTPSSQQRRFQSRGRGGRHVALRLVPQQLGSFQEIDDAVLSLLPKQDRRVRLLDYVNGEDAQPIPFEVMWNVQKEIMEAHSQRLAAATTPTTSSSSAALSLSSNQFLPHHTSTNQPQSSPKGVDTVIFLQHEPVYTLGTGSDPGFIRTSQSHVPIIRMDRGGEVTYHGPGQLVVYLLLDLRSYHMDIHWYIRALEEVALRALRRAGVDGATRNDDTTGVWNDDHKVAAIGVKCRKWVTMHGIAINVDERSLANFDGIVPCGLEGRKVGCVNQFTRRIEPLSIVELSVHVRAALEDVFQIVLVDG